MFDPVHIYLPGPPRGRGAMIPVIEPRPHTMPRGRGPFGHLYIKQVMDKQTRGFQARLTFAAEAAMNGRETISQGPVEVICRAILDIPSSISKKKREQMIAGQILPVKKPDVDNILKMWDALKGVVWDDDARVQRATIEKVYGKHPGLMLRISPALPADLLEGV